MLHGTMKPLGQSPLRRIPRFAILLGLVLANTGLGNDDRQAYQFLVGLVVLESETPGDGMGKSEYYISISRHDPVVEKELGMVSEEIRTVQKEIRQLASQVRDQERMDSDELTDKERKERDALLASLSAQTEEWQTQVKALETRRQALRKLLYGSTEIVSVRGVRFHFADEKIPLKVYEGDEVKVVLFESDAFSNDMFARKTIVLDRELLKKGRLELSSGWAELIELNLIRAEANSR